MPAAGWAARSGRPGAVRRAATSVPEATIAGASPPRRASRSTCSGPTSAISDEAIKEIEHVAPSAERVGAEGPVENAIAFARYASGSFGWNINDPGHGFVIANADRPLDAAAAAPLSASGTWGPLLVTDDAAALPTPLRGYLLDLKPGYDDDPTRAVYNHVWVIGDPTALSVDFQAQVDELAEVAPVTSGSGATTLGPDRPARPSPSPTSRKPRSRPEQMSESERPDRAQRPSRSRSRTCARSPARRPRTSRFRSATGSSA